MPDQEDINNQLEQLKIHRRNLAQYLSQRASLGSAHAPPGNSNGIHETRLDIQRIKSTLQSWNIPVEDLPDDEYRILIEPTRRQTLLRSATQRAPLISAIILILIIITGYYIYSQWFLRQSRLEALTHFNAGKDSLIQGNNDEAILEFKEAIKLDPTNADFYKYQGDAFFSKKSFNLAIQNYDLAIAQQDKFEDAFFKRADAYFNIALQSKKKDDNIKAIEAYHQAIELNPRVSIAYVALGDSEFNIQDYEKAIDAYSTAIHLDPSYPWAFLYRGYVYNSILRYDLAVQDFSEFINKEPNNSDAFYNRALAYDGMKKYALAINDFTHAIDLQLDTPAIYYNRGLAYNGNQDYANAINDFQRAIQKGLDTQELYFNLGLSYIGNKDTESAIEHFSQAILREGDYADAYFNRGLAYLSKNEINLAIADFKATLSKSGDDSPVHKDAQAQLTSLTSPLLIQEP